MEIINYCFKLASLLYVSVMRPYDLIIKKRNGDNLTRDELQFFLKSYLEENVHEYQMSAFLMAVHFQGMNDEEIAVMTETMLNSGSVMDLSDIPGRKIDKHSTGGVGDKISLVLAPLVAEAGVKVPMISGRGLGCTGGTLDKLESVPGFTAYISTDEFKKIVNEVGCVITGTTSDFVPLDRRLYALRDVTATVEVIELIAPSIMSKKLAEGIDALVLDVRSGCGGNVKNDEQARKLANIMVGIGKNMGKEVVAIISDMNQPTGNFVGNALEMYESVMTLRGEGPEDLKTLVVEEGAHMLRMAGITDNLDDGKSRLTALLKSGAAVDRFVKMIEAQKGDTEYILNPEKLLSAKHKKELLSPQTGFLSELHAEKVGLASIEMGAGRKTMDSTPDYEAGIELLKKIGDEVKKNEPLAILHYNDRTDIDTALRMLTDAYKFSAEKTTPPELIRATIYQD